MTLPSLRTWDVGVVVPARNEEESIGRCIASVVASCQIAPLCGRSWITVVADCCTDRTVEMARRALSWRGEVMQCSAGSPGTARRLGCNAVMRYFSDRNPQTLWLANTDADSYVPLDWISTHLRHAQTNADAIAGIVKLDPDVLQPDVGAQFAGNYPLSPDGTHTHVHGANFGVRADAYLDVGGWKDVSVAEDHCLWGRLRQRGWRMRSPVTSIVMTSSRLYGRAIGGFADTLRCGLQANE
jgi:cellulose synthase/poly-beta-1,6-N-acetylglucosamine synthase-like glycosyltransferase